MSFSVIISKLFDGFMINCGLFGITLAIGLPLGLLVAIGSMSSFKPLSWLTKTFVWIIRGTPLMLQILLLFLGPGLIFKKPIWGSGYEGRFLACAIAFIINYACYFSEIFRGGITSIPKGQKEAGQVLGMTKSQIFFKITLLQVIKRIVPPMGNEIITLVKDTSLARVISNQEILMVAETFTPKGLIWPLFSTGIFFLVAVGILTVVLNLVEKKLSYFN